MTRGQINVSQIRIDANNQNKKLQQSPLTFPDISQDMFPLKRVTANLGGAVLPISADSS